MADRCCMAKVAACTSCTIASTGRGGPIAVTVQRTTEAPAAQAVRPAGPSRSTSRRPRAKRRISAMIPSAISRPMTVSLSPCDRQNNAAKP